MFLYASVTDEIVFIFFVRYHNQSLQKITKQFFVIFSLFCFVVFKDSDQLIENNNWYRCD